MSKKKNMTITPELAQVVICGWEQIAPDLAQAAADGGVSTIHVDDLADAISCHLGNELAIPSGVDRFAVIKRAIREHISYGRSTVRF